MKWLGLGAPQLFSIIVVIISDKDEKDKTDFENWQMNWGTQVICVVLFPSHRFRSIPP